MESTIEAMDIETGQSEVLVRSNLHIGAPNWTPDGQAIIANVSGSLYRIPLDRPRLGLIFAETLFAIRNNHGISPDGKTLAITDLSNDTSRACIHVMEIGSETPRRVTRSVPSWFHGFSPDGSEIVYTALRNGMWGIARAPIATGEEHLLLQAKPQSGHHLDGPEFSPDGKTIWFNCDCEDNMSIWRMSEDGSAAERVTLGATEDWFPHPSPDGRHVAFTGFPPGTRGHPYGREVTLNLLDVATGATRTLGRVYGGQGTLNSPSWSPDSRRFAFARHSRDMPARPYV